MKKLSGLTFFVLISAVPSYADLGDNIAKMMFQQKVDEIYKKALACDPLEKDTKASITVSDWIKIQPPLPSWKMLLDIEKTANEASDYAISIGGNDKKRHCLAGCYVAKKLDYPSAVLVGWLKELSDASDCSRKTSFERKDFDATVKGAHGINSKKKCDLFCKK